jgi:hypothetical protein
MGTGSARVLLVSALLVALSGCATGAPKAILSAAELDAMIRVEVERIEPAHADAAVVAVLQP